MPCDTVRQPNQTLEQRKIDVRTTIDRVAKALAKGRVKAVVGQQGGGPLIAAAA